jgi:hypothetical protein
MMLEKSLDQRQRDMRERLSRLMPGAPALKKVKDRRKLKVVDGYWKPTQLAPIVTLSKADERRAEVIIRRIAERAIGGKTGDVRTEAAFMNAISRRVNPLIKASKVMPSVAKAQSEYVEKRKELLEVLVPLKKEILGLERKRLDMLESFKHSCSVLEVEAYPSVPVDTTPAPETSDVSALPANSGVYFVWCGGTIVYVGQSVNLNTRACWRSHHNINRGDEISYLELKREVLTWTESYFIGITRPGRNFGGRRWAGESP